MQGIATGHQIGMEIREYGTDLLLLDEYLLNKDDAQQLADLNAMAATGCPTLLIESREAGRAPLDEETWSFDEVIARPIHSRDLLGRVRMLITVRSISTTRTCAPSRHGCGVSCWISPLRSIHHRS